MLVKNFFNKDNQIHNFISSSGPGTVISYGSGSGSDFLTSYGSGSTSQKSYGSYGSGSTTLYRAGIFLTLNPEWKNSDLGSGINIPDPKH
jgi:hypothetical protein